MHSMAFLEMHSIFVPKSLNGTKNKFGFLFSKKGKKLARITELQNHYLGKNAQFSLFTKQSCENLIFGQSVKQETVDHQNVSDLHRVTLINKLYSSFIKNRIYRYSKILPFTAPKCTFLTPVLKYI